MILKHYLLMRSPVLFNDIVAPNRGITGNPNPGVIRASFAFRAGESLPNRWPRLSVIQESTIIRQSAFLNVFLVSRTIYNEAMPTYFGENVFIFHSTDNFARFITSIGANSRWQLGRAKIHWKGTGSAKAARLLGECFGLRHLTIQLPERNWVTCNSQAPYEARLSGMKDLLRVRGLT